MAYYAVVESVTKLVAMGGDYRSARFSFQEYFEKLGEDAEDGENHLQHYLVDYDAQMAFEIAAIGGKDCMSGTFGDLNVPPTLSIFCS